MKKSLTLFGLIFCVVVISAAFQVTNPATSVTLNSTTNTVPKRSSSTLLADSCMSDDGTTVTLCNQPMSLANVVSKYNNVATAGIGLEPIIAQVALTGKVAAIGTTNLVASVSANSMWHVEAIVNCETTSAAATVNVTVGYTDISNTAQTITGAAAAVCTSLGAAAIVSINLPFAAKSGTAITYSTAIVNTPTYSIRLNLKQESTL